MKTAGFLALLLVISVSAAHAARSFSAVTDADREYTGEAPGARDTMLDIRRIVVEPMRRDGSEGYTAFLVRRRARADAGAPTEEELTLFLAGQYRILGYAAKDPTLYVGRIGLAGERFRILGALALDHPLSPARPVGPPGAYQFASMSPSGETLVLVDRGVVVVDLETGEFRREAVEPEIAADAANPGSQLDGFRLGGDSMTVEWKDGRTGALEVRAPAGGGAARRIAITSPRSGASASATRPGR